MNKRVLQVEITIPLIEFIYANIEDVKDAWINMLGGFVNEHPQYEMSWEMTPQNSDALVLVRIAKAGELEEFSNGEAKGALAAADALFEGKPDTKKTTKKTAKKTRKKSSKKK
ncbi:MAG: hypothetical protein ACFE7R_02220 [Candidatus Hodarchaeota archaeon]